MLPLSTLERRTLETDARLSEALDCSWSPDGRRLAIPGVDGIISVVDVQNGRVLQEARPGGRHVYGLTWTRDSQAVIIASVDDIGTYGIERYDLRQNRRSVLLVLPGKRSVDSLSLSPDGRLLLFHIDNNPLPFPQSGTPADKHIVIFDGVSTRMLTTGEAPAWHPSGTLIGFSRRIEQLGPFDYGVFVMDYR